MACLHPITLRYHRGFDNGNNRLSGYVCSSRTGSSYIQVPCGRCIECRIARTREWAIRLMHENQYSRYSYFLTLTYDDEHIPVSGSLVKDDLQRFWKRLRKRCGKLRYYACGEYGEHTFRPHYHAIVYSEVGFNDEDVRNCWTNGFVKFGTVTEDSCAYVSGYVQKKLYGKGADVYRRFSLLPPFSVCSRGIGIRWLRDNESVVRDNLSIRFKGKSCPVPRYYRKVLGIDADCFAEHFPNDIPVYDGLSIAKLGYDSNAPKSLEDLYALADKAESYKSLVRKNTEQKERLFGKRSKI